MSKTLDQLVGQLIIAGFRNDKVTDSSNISATSKNIISLGSYFMMKTWKKID